MTEHRERTPDHHMYRSVVFFRDSLELLAAALQYYVGLLERDLSYIKDDPELASILGEKILDTLPVTEELREARWHRDKFNEKLSGGEDFGAHWEFGVSHGTVRFLKSVSFLYLEYLERRRDQLADQVPLSKSMLDAIDARITELREQGNQGVFKEAEPRPLLVQQLPEVQRPSKEQEPAKSEPAPTRPPPRVSTSIQLIDAQLRERCLDLFNTFDENDQPHRYDTVIAEATRVLEDRIRVLSGAEANVSGVDLVKHAFHESDPKLRLSPKPGEQQAAHLMFRGVFGFVRNPVHHALSEHLEKERVIQLLGFVDYLIHLVGAAERDQ